MTYELQESDAVAQSELISRGDVTRGGLVETAISRISSGNPLLNAVVTPMFEHGREAAAVAQPHGRLAGIPFLLKDLGAEAQGIRHTEGSRFLRAFVSHEDSTFVRRLRLAGVNFLGKTNTPEFGDSATTEPKLFGPTRNPWGLDLSAGGSSGGSAAAVAARWVTMAHASDVGGSIRIPASCCGVFGLKPSSEAGGLPRTWCFDFGVEHAVTISVRDSEALLAGVSEGGHLPANSRTAEGQKTPRRRVAVTNNHPDLDLHRETKAAVEEAADLCTNLGHAVSDASPDFDLLALLNSCNMLWAEQLAATVASWIQRVGTTPGPGDLERQTEATLAFAERRSAAQHMHDVAVLVTEGRKIIDFFDEFDVWLTPGLAEPPPKLGRLTYGEEDIEQFWDRTVRYITYMPVANVTGQPAMSVPLHWTSAGYPLGAHFIGPPSGDAVMFELASELEQAAPWSTKAPPNIGWKDA